MRMCWNGPRPAPPPDADADVEPSSSRCLAISKRFEGRREVGGVAIRRGRLPRSRRCVPAAIERTAIERIKSRLRALRARRDLIRRRIAGRRGSLSAENVVQDLGGSRRIPVLQAISPQRGAGGVRSIEPLHPLCRFCQQLRVLGDDHHRVHARDRLEAKDPIAQATIAGLKYPLELRDHRLRRGRLERVDADRLIAQPLHIEGRDQVERRLPFGGRALDQQQVARWNDTDRARPRQKSLCRLGDRRGGNVTQRYERNTESLLPGSCGDGRAASGLGHRNDLDQAAVAHDRRIRHPQHAFQRRHHVLARDRADRRKRHFTLDARVDHDIELENVPEKRLGDCAYVGPVKVHLDALAPDQNGRLRRRYAFGALIALRFGIGRSARKDERL